jgi:hypothetical protein
MKKNAVFLFIMLAVVANGFALALGQRIIIPFDKEKIFLINTRGGACDTFSYSVRKEARPFINESNVYSLIESEYEYFTLPDSVITGWSRVFKKDIHLERRLIIVENQIFLYYDSDIKEEYSSYIFSSFVFGVLAIILIIIVALGSKIYISFRGILIDFFILLFFILLSMWFLIKIQVFSIGIGYITFYDVLILPILTILPAFLITFLKDRR